MKTVHLIANSNSGQGAGGSIPEMVARVCVEKNIELIHYKLDEPDAIDSEAEKAAVAALKDGGVVVAAGGDGTIRGVAEKIYGKDIKFGVIACGTFNYFSRTHNLPEDHEEAFRAILDGIPKKVRLGEVNGRVFLINASIGLYAKSIRDREKRTSIFGRNRIVALASSVITLFQGHRLIDVSLNVNNKKIKMQTPMIFIGNNKLQLRNLDMEVAKCMKLDMLAVVLMTPLKTWEMARVLFRGIASRLDDEQGLTTFCVDDLLIETHSRKSSIVALDGEMFRLHSPLQVKSLPGALTLMLPKENT